MKRLPSEGESFVDVDVVHPDGQGPMVFVVIGKESEGCALTPKHARELARLIVETAELAERGVA